MSIKNRLKTIFSLEEDEYEYAEEQFEETEESTVKPKERKNVVSLHALQNKSKVVLCEPKTYNEVQEIADHIVNRRAVVINLQRLDNQEARRIVDFLSGTVYAVSGNIQKLGSHTFLCTPENVDVSGNISDLLENEELEQRW
ncbi:cell division protein SepF [Radiobacillus sp. PE A8.2]|uniref:cell division protein SepF n=1 Tax=Radiobacillus sp. PE A8.2 TaxID=3380349 RepID=UPI00388E66B7